MANTTNYNWETPDDTDLVKDGAAAIRTLGSSIDTTTKALNPETTLGDISYRSSTANTNTRLGIGTTGQVLTVSGGVPAWQSISAGGMTQIATGSFPSASTLTISSIPNSYKNLQLVLRDVSGAADVNVRMRFNGDSSSLYGIATSNQGGSSLPLSSDNFDIYYIVTAGSTDNLAVIDVPDYANTTTHKMMQICSYYKEDATNFAVRLTRGAYRSTSAVSSITLYTASGNNYSAGTYILYGVS